MDKTAAPHVRQQTNSARLDRVLDTHSQSHSIHRTPHEEEQLWLFWMVGLFCLLSTMLLMWRLVQYVLKNRGYLSSIVIVCYLDICFGFASFMWWTILLGRVGLCVSMQPSSSVLILSVSLGSKTTGRLW